MRFMVSQLMAESKSQSLAGLWAAYALQLNHRCFATEDTEITESIEGIEQRFIHF